MTGFLREAMRRVPPAGERTRDSLWRRINRCGVILLLFAFVIGAWAQPGRVTSFSPPEVAQGFPWFEDFYPQEIFVDAEFGGPTEQPTNLRLYRVGQADPFLSFFQLSVSPVFDGQTFVGHRILVFLDSQVSEELGEVEAVACRLEFSVCTDRENSARLLVRPQIVTTIEPNRITTGASEQTVTVSYLLESYDSDFQEPEQFLANFYLQGVIVSPPIPATVVGPTGPDNQYDSLNKQVIVEVPSEVLDNPGEYKLVITELWDIYEMERSTSLELSTEVLEIVEAPEILTTSPLPPGNVGLEYFATIQVSGGVPEAEGEYNWELEEGDELPPGLELGTSGTSATISGTPTQAGTFNFTVIVSDAFGVSDQREFQLVIGPPIAPLQWISTSPLPPAVVNQPYSYQLMVTGGVPPYYFFEAYGALGGSGLSLSETGLITGVPEQEGTFFFEIGVYDSLENVVYREFTLVVGPAGPPLQLSSTSPLPPATEGEAYSFQFQATGGTAPYFFFIDSQTPQQIPGLILSEGGVLSGIPAEEGTYIVTVSVMDQQENLASGQFTLVVASAVPPPQILTDATLPTGRVGLPYSASIQIEGGVEPLRVQVAGDLLPPGLVIDPSSLVISGTPTQATVNSFLLEVTDARNRRTERLFTLAVVDALEISNQPRLPDAEEQIAYGVRIATSGGVEPVSLRVLAGSLPPGLALTSELSRISGTPTLPGDFAFTLEAEDAEGFKASKAFELHVRASLSRLSLLPMDELPDLFVGQAFSRQFGAQGGEEPYTYSIEGSMLPPGLTLDAATGLLSGTPTAPADLDLTIRVTDSTEPPQQDQRLFRLRILQPLEFTLLELPAGVADEPYSAQFAAQGGTLSYSFAVSAGSLPEGFTLSPDGLLSGTAASPTTSTFTVTVTDGEARTAMRAFTLQILPKTIPGGSLNLSSAIGVANSQNAVTVSLSAPQDAEVTGAVTLEVIPAGGQGMDDPAVQFVAGGRSVSFVIPAGETTAQFNGASSASFQTGTIAATLRFTASFQIGGLNATPDPAPQATIEIPVTPPSISDLQVTRTPGGLQIVILGFSPERVVNSVLLSFTRRPGAPGESPVQVEVNVAQAFQAWFNSEDSRPFGSQFRLTIPVTLTGDPQDIVSVVVRLTSPAGTGNTVNASF